MRNRCAKIRVFEWVIKIPWRIADSYAIMRLENKKQVVKKWIKQHIRT